MFFVLAYSRIGLIILERTTSLEIVAEYNSAFFILFALQMGVSTIMQVIYPKLTKVFVNRYQVIFDCIVSIFKVLVPVVSLVALTLFYFSDEVINLLYGIEYHNSIPLFKLLIWIFPLFTISTFFSNFFRASGNQKTIATIAGLGLILNLIFSLIFVAKYGGKGLAMAYIISESFIGLSCIVIVLRLKFSARRLLAYLLGKSCLLVVIAFSLCYETFGLSFTQFYFLSLALITTVGLLLFKKMDLMYLKMFLNEDK